MTSVHVPVRVLGIAVIAVAFLATVLSGVPVAADTDIIPGAQALIVNTDNEGVRLRTGPTTDTETLRLLQDYWRVTVLDGPISGEGGSWYRAEHTGAIGYLFANYLTTATGATGVLTVGETVQVVTEDGTALRLRGAPNGDVVATMPHKAEVKVVSGPTPVDGKRWYGVAYEGVTGFAVGDYLRPVTQASLLALRDTTSRAGSRGEAPAPKPAESNRGALIVQAAMKYQGARYAWGGSSPAGFDCSGFTRYVVREALGIDIGRDTFAQINAGVPVPADDLQPGDLVFQQNTYRWGLSHVGIYIGGGRMINAQSERAGVTITNMWDAYWGQRYYAARRL